MVNFKIQKAILLICFNFELVFEKIRILLRTLILRILRKRLSRRVKLSFYSFYNFRKINYCRGEEIVLRIENKNNKICFFT